MSYDGHKSCVTENERYGGKDYVEKGNKVTLLHFIPYFNDF